MLQLEKEINFFQQHLDEWLKLSPGKYALIKGDELIGTYGDVDEALSEGARRYGLKPFLVRPIVEKQEEVSVPALTLGLLHANVTHSN